MNIERRRGAYTGRNKSTAYQDLVWKWTNTGAPGWVIIRSIGRREPVSELHWLGTH